MDEIERAREMFLELESRKKGSAHVAQRNFEIQSRLAMKIEA